MYESFFGLRDKPFNVTPDPRYLYLSDSHEEALSALLYGIRERKGLVTLTGPVGVGKTTVLFSFFQRIEGEAEIAFFPGGVTGSRVDFFCELCKQFRIPVESASLFDLTRALKGFTARKLEEGRNVIVLVDEAQDLAVEELNHFRYLNNLETPDAKFLQIVLAGMPELDEKLRDEKLLSLRQRIAIRCVIQPLDPQAAVEYVLHRLRVAGSASDDLFTLDALARVVNCTQGVPRRINVLCDNAMIVAFALKKARVEEAFVVEALEGMDGECRQAGGEPVVSREEVAVLYDAATRRLGERESPGGAAAHAVGGRPGSLPDGRAAGVSGSVPGRPDAGLARKVSVGHLEGVPVPRSWRPAAIIAVLVLAGLVLAGLFVRQSRSPDQAEERGPALSPEATPLGPAAIGEQGASPLPEGPIPFAGFLTAGLKRERLDAGPAASAPEPPGADEDVLPEPSAPHGEPGPGPRGLAAVVQAAYGTLTLGVLEDLARRNPEIRDWNQVDSAEGLRLPGDAALAGVQVDFFSVQVSSFRQERNILKSAARLCAEDVRNVFVLGPGPAEDGDGGWYRCCAGVFGSVPDAEPWMERLRRTGFRDAFVVRVQGVPLREIRFPCP